MAYISDYVKGIERDLDNVSADNAHPLVKHSILSQAKRLGEIAENSYKFHKKHLLDEINELAKFHSVEIPVLDLDSDKTASLIKMISLEELSSILKEVLEPDSLEIYDNNNKKGE